MLIEEIKKHVVVADLTSAQKKSLDYFLEKGFPTTKDEDWKSDINRFQKVKSISINSILKSKFDYFSLDVEGAEFDILRNIDWENIVKPDHLTIEVNNYGGKNKEKILNLLENNGYEPIFMKYEWLTKGDLWLSLRT